MNKYAKLKFHLKNYIISSVSGFFHEHQWCEKQILKNSAVPVPKSVNLKLASDSAAHYELRCAMHQQRVPRIIT